MNNDLQVNISSETLVGHLIGEYSRVSDGFHGAVDNYYKILPLILSAVVLILGLASKVGTEVVYGFVPFLLLILFLAESQIRTTIICESHYLSLLEERINKLVGFPLLLHESKLTLGRTLYYSPNMYSVFKYLSYLPFFAIGGALFLFSVAKFSSYLFSKNSIGIFGYSLCSQVAWWVYIVFISSLTLISLISWVAIFYFSTTKYRQKIEEIYQEVLFEKH